MTTTSGATVPQITFPGQAAAEGPVDLMSMDLSYASWPRGSGSGTSWVPHSVPAAVFPQVLAFVAVATGRPFEFGEHDRAIVEQVVHDLALQWDGPQSCST